MTCHDISWHVMMRPLLIQRGSLKLWLKLSSISELQNTLKWKSLPVLKQNWGLHLRGLCVTADLEKRAFPSCLGIILYECPRRREIFRDSFTFPVNFMHSASPHLKLAVCNNSQLLANCVFRVSFPVCYYYSWGWTSTNPRYKIVLHVHVHVCQLHVSNFLVEWLLHIRITTLKFYSCQSRRTKRSTGLPQERAYTYSGKNEWI